jgi:predicted metal-binding membrane protein
MRTSNIFKPPALAARSAVVATAATVTLAGAGWIVTVPRMSGMDMGASSTLGSFPFFLSVWVPMMTAMMLPAVAPSALGRAVRAWPQYVGSYLAVWVLFGVVVFAAYRPHSHTVAGVIVAAAGVYEATPVKRRLREMSQEHFSSGLGLGVCCVGSTAGLMLVMVALGPMSLTWMIAVTAVVVLQKLAPPKAFIDIPVAIAILGVAAAQFA